MHPSIPLLCCSLFYLALISIVYFRKKRINLIENKIYSIIIFISIIGILLDILGIYCNINLPVDSMIRFIVVKLYFIYLLAYIMAFTLYIVVSSATTKKKNKLLTKIMIMFSLLFVILSIVSIQLPFEYYNDGKIIYVYGKNSNFLYAITGIFLVFSIIYIFINLKQLEKNKYILLLTLILLGIPVAICQLLHPELLLVTSLYTAVTILMYFTIENPDIQMLRELHKQKEIANESNIEKSSFLFSISNQIKEPVLLISHISGEALLEDNTEKVKEDLQKIKYSSNELLKLMDNVLDISDIEKRKINIRKNRYSVHNLFEIIYKNFCEKINKKIECRFHFDKSIPEYLYGDSVRIKQIMGILLDNALRYTNDGFIEINVNSIIKYDICRLIITVEDSGQGISPEKINQLFDKEKIYSDKLLKNIDDTKSNLGVLKSIVNLMNGNVIVNSEIGKGSKFTIIIDQLIKEEKTEITRAVEQYEEIYEKKEKILLVINHEQILKQIKKVLKKDSYKLEEVNGGQPCLEKIRNKEKFNLIIIEEELEKLSSEDTLKKLKETTEYKTPVLLISKNRTFGSKEMYQEKGFTDVIFLPLSKEQLLKQVREYIKK